MMQPIEWVELRTTTPNTAGAAYAEILALEFRPRADGTGGLLCDPRGPVLDVTPLPERARALGAPPHWLGYIGVDDVDAAAARFLAQGAQALGPTQRFAGRDVAIFRDPLGAVIALRSRGETSRVVSWRMLHVTDHERALAAYAAAFEWRARALEALPNGDLERRFVWDDAGPVAGAITNSALSPAVHPHWVFGFTVRDLDDALARVIAHGGRTLSVASLASGARIAVCEDAASAEFGLSTR